MRIILLTTFLCVLNLHFYAQTTNAFRVNYDQALLDLPGNTTESLTPNQYVFAGSAVNFIPVYGTVTELDNAGNLLWSKRYYDGSFGFQINDVKKDQASNEYFVCGGSDLNDGVFMRLDANGNIVMSARFGIDEADGAFLSRIIKTSDGNYLAAGYVTGHNPDGAGPEEYFEPITYTDNNGDQQTEYFHSPLLVKFDPSGNAIWHHVARYYKTATADPNDRIYNDAYFRDIVEVADGYMAVGSYKVNDHLSSTNNDGDDNTPTDATIFKTDFNGNITFHKQVDNPNTDPSQNSKYLSAINKTSAGDPIAGGYTNQRELVMKYGATGGFSLTFSRRFEYSSSFLGGTDPVDISQIYEADGSTDIVTMGMYIRPLSFEFNNSIHRMNASATSTNWAKKYSLGGPTILPRGQQVSDGGFLMSSTTMGTSFDYQIIKTDPDGETPINDCEAENFSPSASGGPTTIADPYYKTWQGTTGPTTLNLSVDNINPAPNFICQHSPCTPPPLADDVTATEDPICAGESTTINASGSATGVSYNVYDAPSGGNNLGSAPHTVSPATTTTYYVETVDDADPNCVSTSRVPIEITVNPAPTADPSSNSPLCEGQNLELTATTVSGASYEWTGPGGYSSTDQNPIINNVTSADEGTYTLIVTANGCPSAPEDVNVIISEPPTSNPDAVEVEICEGEDIELLGNNVSGGSYDWSGPGGFTSTDQNPTINNATTAESGNYTLEISVGSCTSTPEEISITVNPSPTVSASNDGPICVGDNVNFSSSGGNTYSWSGPNSYSNNNQNFTLNNVDLSDEGVYEVLVTDNNNCSNTGQTTLTINEGPDLSLSSEDVSCFGESDGEASVVATGNNPFTYSWSPGGQSTDNITNLPEGNYSVTVEDNNGCSSSESIQVNEPDEIELTFNTVDAECNVENGSAEVIASGGAGGFTYSWSPGGETTNEITDIGAGVYEVTVTDGTSCSVTESVSVNSSNAPEITVESITHVSCNGENDGSVEVSVTGGTSPYSYQWSPSGGNSQLEEDLSAGTYEVTVTDDDDCPAVLEVVIEEPDEIQLDGTTSDAFCGNLDGSINLEVTGGAEPYTYDWVDEDVSGQNPTDLPPGEYEVTVIDDNGCISTDIFNVDVTGDIPFNVNPQIVTIENGESTQLEVIIGNGVTGENYEWSPTDGLSCISCPNPMASPSETTTYTVTVSTDDGCVSSDTILVIVEDACSDVFIPNIFSPNDDNNNDYLCVEGTCIASINLSIYNRWGEKVFETKDPNECWDGTYKGERLNTGVFAYKALITTVDGQELDKSGNLTLVK